MAIYVTMMIVLIILTISTFISVTYNIPKTRFTEEPEDIFIKEEEKEEEIEKEELLIEEFIAFDQARKNR